MHLKMVRVEPEENPS